MMWYGDGWGGWIMMTVVMVLFWGGVIAAAVWGIRALSSSGRGQSSAPAAPRAEEVLAQRFARGEIDEEEFQRRMNLLHQPH
jgi:putative membrane protein